MITNHDLEADDKPEPNIVLIAIERVDSEADAVSGLDSDPISSN